MPLVLTKLPKWCLGLKPRVVEVEEPSGKVTRRWFGPEDRFRDTDEEFRRAEEARNAAFRPAAEPPEEK